MTDPSDTPAATSNTDAQQDQPAPVINFVLLEPLIVNEAFGSRGATLANEKPPSSSEKGGK